MEAVHSSLSGQPVPMEILHPPRSGWRAHRLIAACESDHYRGFVCSCDQDTAGFEHRPSSSISRCGQALSCRADSVASCGRPSLSKQKPVQARPGHQTGAALS